MSTLVFGAPQKRKAAETRTCSVCTDDKRIFLKCPDCGQEACSDCYASYFESSSLVVAPQCMFRVTRVDGTSTQCGCEFAEGVLGSVFGSAFAKKIVRDRRVNRIEHRDSFFRKDTEFFIMPIVRRHIADFENLGVHAKRIMDDACSYAELNESRRILDGAKAGTHFHRFTAMMQTPIGRLMTGGASLERPKKAYTQYELCSKAPECDGMFNMDVGECLACKTKHCTSCFKELGEGHECDAGDVANAKYKIDNTKPCPKCKYPIEKGPDCSQMMCTLCRCVYDWNTLRPARANEWIHNPLYHALSEKERAEARALLARDEKTEGRPDDAAHARLHDAANNISSTLWIKKPWVPELDRAVTYAYQRWLASRAAATDQFDFEMAERFDRIQSILGHHLPDTRFPRNATATTILDKVNEFVNHKKAFTKKEHEANMLRRDTVAQAQAAQSKALRDYVDFVSALSDRLRDKALVQDTPELENLAELVIGPWIEYVRDNRKAVATQFGESYATCPPTVIQWLSSRKAGPSTAVKCM